MNAQTLQDFASRGLRAQKAADAAVESAEKISGHAPTQGLPGAQAGGDQETSPSPPAHHFKTLNPTCFLNREACREYLLEAAKSRAHKFDRVSGETLHQLNEQVRALMHGVVRRLPSKGKTI